MKRKKDEKNRQRKRQTKLNTFISNAVTDKIGFMWSLFASLKN